MSNPMQASGKLLWTPSNVEQTQMFKFQRHIAQKYQVQLDNYESLQKWSTANIPEFWQEVWNWNEPVKASKLSNQVIDLTVPMQDIPSWFEGAKLNWAENMLQAGMKTPEKVAVIECSEPAANEPMEYKQITYGTLIDQVHSVALSLRQLGLKPNSILCYYGPTSAASLVLLLATTSIGAIWSSAASDFGANGVLERFEQFLNDEDSNRLWGIVGVDSVRYNGKIISQRSKFDAVVDGLKKQRKQGANQLEVIVQDYLGVGRQEPLNEGYRDFDEFVEIGNKDKASNALSFEQVSFDQPLWVLFSSGTTGKPKPIVHRAGGMLLQSKKEHVIHGDVTAKDVFYYYTTPGWMMYNYLVSALQTGCTLIMYDGSPLFRPELLWKMVDDVGVTVFGTSAKYIDVLSKGYEPKEKHSLSTLKQILSTGSPLKPELFSWVYDHIKQDVLLGSITGGTDICSLFAGHNTALPVYEGEIQCICLGMQIESWSDDAKTLPHGQQGELVCAKPFPCMPIFFWGDSKDHARYRSSYFDKFEGVWAHGDFCIITPSRNGNGGGLLMLGRSDGVLNPSGIRFGSAEIYEVCDTFSPSADNAGQFNVIEDSLVVGQKTQGGADERVVLFVKLVDGNELSEALLKEIKLRVRTARSARHVPERIIAVQDIPHTINGKKVEVPIKKLLNGAPLSSINASTLRNPECLQEYVELGQQLRKEVA
ncbi:hypothetical protein OIO90_003191 [Microbotryomycetes sp. JL221]|nr:hypothetical protein OIO90_003191 [Microbotryomycetes sp. JL221]